MPHRTRVVLAALALAAGCGDGDSKPEAEKRPVKTAGTKPTPDDGGLKAMEPGEYRSSKFRPRVRFRLTQRMWQKEFETPDSIGLYDWGEAESEPDGSVLHILRPGGVFDVKDASDPNGKRWPRDLAGWLDRQPHVEVGPSRKAEVGGRPARVFDVRADEDGVQLFVDSAGQMPSVGRDWPARIYVLGEGREQRAIMLVVPRDKVPEGFEPLEEILETIRFAD